MKEGLDIAHIAVFIGNPACASMLIALMRGKVLTVSELASESGVTIIRPAFTFQNWIMEDFWGRPNKGYTSIFHCQKTMLRKARVCYNHSASDMDTQLFDSLTAQRYFAWDGEDLIRFEQLRWA